MKNKLLYIFMAVSLLAGMSSCNEKWEVPGGDHSDKEDGSGMLSTKDLVLDVINAEEIKQSRATEDFSDYLVSIINKKTEKVDTVWKYSEMPGLPVFNVGEYTLKVESGELQRAAWNAPYFVGSKDFTIIKDQITNIGTVTCKLQNLKVTVIFDDELKAAAGNDVQCEIQTVSAGTEDAALVYTLNEKRDGYFELLPGGTTMLAKFTGTVNGFGESFVTTFSDVKVGQHYIITFHLRTGDYEIPDATGTVNFGNLNINMNVTHKDMTHNIDAGEDNIEGERPGKEDWGEEPTPPGPDNPNQPTPGEGKIEFNSEYLDLKTGNKNLSTEFGTEEWGDDLHPAVVVITAENKVQDLEVTIDSPTLDVSEVGLKNNFNLAVPGSMEGDLKSLGFPVGNEVRGQETVTFDISGFIPLLVSFDGSHKFTIKVTDQKGASKTLVLTFANK